MQQQSTSLGKKSVTQGLRDVAETTQETAETISTGLSARASRIAQDTAESAGQYYSQANNWLQQNYGKALGVVGTLAAAGMIGYWIGRNEKQGGINAPIERI